jgi:hypothetical protein
LALALADPAFRSYLKDSLDRSPVREHKLHFQRLLRGPDRRALVALAQAAGEVESAVDMDARAASALELYLPVPAHRAGWRGGEDILVATAREDHEAPVAFDVRGRRRLLNPEAPPATPVLALVPAETDFDATPGVGLMVADDGGSPPGSGGGGTGSSSLAGLYMTSSHFVDEFEGWLKGSPEFEIHVLGQAGASDSLTSYQCAGEHASGYYRFDQNDLDWTGSVLLFTQTQLANYKAAHPGSNMRIFVVEDDDTACQIKTDVNRFASLIRTVESAYPLLTGGKDTTTAVRKYWKRANALQRILKAIASLITTSDELVGNAVESAVAGEYYPGANWVVKGEGNATNGWLNLVMH